MGTIFVKGAGAALTKDLLWENQNPTATFSSATILTDIQKYDAIMIEYRKSTSDSSMVRALYDISDRGSAFSGDYRMAMMFSTGGNTWYTRYSEITSVTQITLGGTWRLGSSGYNDGYCIPVRVYGVTGVFTN